MRKVEIEHCPPGNARGAIETEIDKRLGGWRLQVVGEGRGKEKWRKKYLERLDEKHVA